ncbi:MAG: polyprenyl synthetase family protein [Candidatus Omnitrophica bacterium]|nr:polyprenyl synthetase family protein [Candidatus Omnitrophota bacterium]
MRYAVLGEGKRFRPALVLSACEAVGGNPKQALLPACAVEFVHAYSLIHDDLPALDNDEMRRGKPTCHKKFGEAIAILAGDALLTQAFHLLSEAKPPEKALHLIRELADAAGTKGMVGGQVVDILLARNGANREVDLSTLDYISQHKTGRLIQASAVLGAIVGTSSSSKIKRIREFGWLLGFAFQVVDDIMDGDGYLRVMSSDEACQKAESLIEKAKQEAESFGKKGKRLTSVADFLNVPVGSKN